MTPAGGVDIRRVGIVARRSHDQIGAVVERLQNFADASGLELVFEEGLEGQPFVDGCELVDLDHTDVDLIVALGGDGTLLRAGRFAASREIPVIGINMGHLGFLTASPHRDMEERLGMVLTGEYDLDRRSVLEATVSRDGVQKDSQIALNDFVLHKTGVARVALLDVQVEEGDTKHDLGTFSGDGLIFATPTGSTAYSLSAGGPIVTPAVDGVVLTPICPHTLAARPLVIPGDQVITVRTPEETEDLVLTVDGQMYERISSGDEIRIRVSDFAVPLIRFPDQAFYSTIRQKLQWAARPNSEKKAE